MWIAFYRGPGDWITRFIRRGTRGPYSHVELVFSDLTSFGASGRENCVRFQRIKSFRHWDLISLPLSADQERTLRVACEELAGLGFDWLGLLRTCCRDWRNAAGIVRSSTPVWRGISSGGFHR